MDKYIIGKCNMCGIDMIVGTPIEDKVVCHNCYSKYEKDKVDFLQELSNKQKQTIADLEAKLAEKDKNNKLLEAMISTLPEHDKELEERHNQDKIEFAVEQLEKVKEIIAIHTKDLWTYESDYICNILCNEIDNQIKQLKEGK